MPLTRAIEGHRHGQKMTHKTFSENQAFFKRNMLRKGLLIRHHFGHLAGNFRSEFKMLLPEIVNRRENDQLEYE